MGDNETLTNGKDCATDCEFPRDGCAITRAEFDEMIGAVIDLQTGAQAMQRTVSRLPRTMERQEGRHFRSINKKMSQLVSVGESLAKHGSKIFLVLVLCLAGCVLCLGLLTAYVTKTSFESYGFKQVHVYPTAERSKP